MRWTCVAVAAAIAIGAWLIAGPALAQAEIAASTLDPAEWPRALRLAALLGAAGILFAALVALLRGADDVPTLSGLKDFAPQTPPDGRAGGFEALDRLRARLAPETPQRDSAAQVDAEPVSAEPDPNAVPPSDAVASLPPPEDAEAGAIPLIEADGAAPRPEDPVARLLLQIEEDMRRCGRLAASEPPPRSRWSRARRAQWRDRSARLAPTRPEPGAPPASTAAEDRPTPTVEDSSLEEILLHRIRQVGKSATAQRRNKEKGDRDDGAAPTS